jgi:geranyl-CoA carboxylase beta subunit
MPKLTSRLNTGSDDYRRAVEAMGEKLNEVRGLEDKVRANSAAKKQRFEERGQILPRERVARLLDRDQPFLEIAPLAGLKMHDDDGDRVIDERQKSSVHYEHYHGDLKEHGTWGI